MYIWVLTHFIVQYVVLLIKLFEARALDAAYVKNYKFWFDFFLPINDIFCFANFECYSEYIIHGAFWESLLN